MARLPRMDPELAAKHQRLRRFSRVPVRVLLPNIITLLALVCGLTSIRFALEAKFEFAVAAIIIAGVLDALDGRIARLLKSATRFGAELDSLTDFVNFGVAPAIVLYLWALQELKALGWIVVMALALCCVLRLARFNIALDDPDKPAWKANYFMGVPAPAGAGLALLPMFLTFLGGLDQAYAGFVLLLYVPFVAFLMVSRVPTFSGKLIGQRVRREVVAPFLIIAVLFAALVASYPWGMLTLLTFVYLCSLPVSAWRYRKLEELHDSKGKTSESGEDNHEPSIDIY
jgi:CDP-diacylglycerol---serine O-phosphatidyltransferase